MKLSMRRSELALSLKVEESRSFPMSSTALLRSPSPYPQPYANDCTTSKTKHYTNTFPVPSKITTVFLVFYPMVRCQCPTPHFSWSLYTAYEGSRYMVDTEYVITLMMPADSFALRSCFSTVIAYFPWSIRFLRYFFIVDLRRRDVSFISNWYLFLRDYSLRGSRHCGFSFWVVRIVGFMCTALTWGWELLGVRTGQMQLKGKGTVKYWMLGLF